MTIRDRTNWLTWLIAWLGAISCVPAGAAGDAAAPAPTARQSHGHFHPKGQLPSAATVAQRAVVSATLPFTDQRDFEESRRGFLAAPAYRQIRNGQGEVVWDMGAYDFLLGGKDFASIHPSLQRQAVLNMGYGLYEVVPGHIYQVRGFDISNISFIRGDTGWIVFDPLVSHETAGAALALVNEKLGVRPIRAVVYSHSHVDHFGGVRGIVDEADVRSGKVQIIAPAGFMRAAVEENVYAGNAMARRAMYQYGLLLAVSPFGNVDSAIGKRASAGVSGLIAPTRTISAAFESVTIDGIDMVFQATPGTEAPAEMNTWLPQFKAFWAAENITATIHNIYTLRGALIRDPLQWSKGINEALYRFGQQAEVMFAAHSWPRWGNERIQDVMRVQRDTYANLNNGVLHAANNGVTINEIHNVYQSPPSLQQHWEARSYHGSEEHNSRGVINRYLGYWDGNPATLTPLSPRESAPLFVEMMGGSVKILARGRELIAAGKYLYATAILDKLVYAEPGNQAAKDLLAEAFEQIGYQKESASLRNAFLAAALELRSGIPTGLAARSYSPDVIRAMPTDLWLDYLGILVDSHRAAGVVFVINLVIPDQGEQYVLEMSNATLTNIKGVQAARADLTVRVNRSDLEPIMMQQASFASQAAAGKAQLEGDPRALQQLLGTLVPFDPAFEILPGTKRSPAP